MADRIFVDQQSSTEAPFVFLVNILPDGSATQIQTFYESIHYRSNWGIHPNGYPYWSDTFAPLLEAARFTTSGGNFFLEYLIPRYPSTAASNANVGFTHIAQTAVATTTASSGNAALTAVASTVARSTVASSANAANSNTVRTVASSTTSSTANASLSAAASVQGVTTTSSAVNAASTVTFRSVATTTAASSANAATTLVANSFTVNYVASTVNAGLTSTQSTTARSTTSSTANAALTSTQTTTRATTAASSANAALTQTASSAVSGNAYTETFTGSNGAAWSNRWTLITGSWSIQNNAGVLTSPGSAYTGARAHYTYMPSNTIDQSVLATVTALNTSNSVEQYAFVGIDGDKNDTASGGNPAYGVYVQLNYQSQNSWSVWQGSTQIGSNISMTINAGSVYKVRFQRSNQVFSAKVWDASGAEPGSWGTTFNQSVLPNQTNPAGTVFLVGTSDSNGNVHSFAFDDVAINY